jgi:hypothetical protein
MPTTGIRNLALDFWSVASSHRNQNLGESTAESHHEVCRNPWSGILQTSGLLYLFIIATLAKFSILIYYYARKPLATIVGQRKLLQVTRAKPVGLIVMEHSRSLRPLDYVFQTQGPG